ATGGTIVTSLDLGLQQRLERQVRHHVERNRRRGIVNAAALLIDTATAEIVASVGSADFFDDAIDGQVDGTRAKRSPGSTLKPFIYALALERGLIHPLTLMKDAPQRFGAYAPENYDRGFVGPVVARDALIHSRNVPALTLLLDIGEESFHAWLSSGGVAGMRDADHYGLGLALGANELTMEELAGLYVTLANGGVWRELAHTPGGAGRPRARRLLSPEASFLTLDMLRHNPRPGRRAAPRTGHPWKTGTSYAFRDAWSVGVVGNYVLAVWVGNFDGSGNPAFVGRQAAAPLFFAIADTLGAELWPARPSPDLKLVTVDVCEPTGDLACRHCPATTPAWFIPGVSPIRVSDVHREIRIDAASGLRACHNDPSTTRGAVFEFWPSDIDALFRRAGLAKPQPPAWHPDCSLDRRAASGTPPVIASPLRRVTYRRDARRNELPLRAVTDGDVETVYWFVDNALVARTAHDATAYWQMTPGTHQVLVVDDAGRAAERRINVR
ncbi:MAG: penicillin-binding transpeptidase domain-containing protein, partial [Pseudomonadota bacterium]